MYNQKIHGSWFASLKFMVDTSIVKRVYNINQQTYLSTYT